MSLRAAALLLAVAWACDVMAGAAPAQAPSGGPPAAPASGLQEIRRLIDGGQAKAALQQLSALDQTRDDVRFLRGIALYHADQPAAAVEALEPVRAGLPEGSAERAEAEQVLGLSLFLLNRHAEAVPLLERTRARLPGNQELLFTLGQAYIHLRDVAKAREAVAGAFGLEPGAPAAGVAAAQLMIRLQMEPLAEAELRATIEKSPGVLRAHFLLGQLALFRGQLDEAIAFTRRELTLNPTDAMALAQLGDAYTRKGEWDEAIPVLQQSLWLNPFYSSPYILLGRSYAKKGNPATAEGMLRRAIEYDPNNRVAHYLLGQVLQQLGRDEEARQAFATAERLQRAGR